MVDVEQVRHWIEAAQPGARLLYFTGLFAGHGSQRLNDRLQAEAARGMIYLVQQRRHSAPFGFDYLAVRSSRPCGPEAPEQRPAAQLDDRRDYARMPSRRVWA